MFKSQSQNQLEPITSVSDRPYFLGLYRGNFGSLSSVTYTKSPNQFSFQSIISVTLDSLNG
ncbi:MAG: hypothetical protein WCG25_09000 [bacterium]